MVKKLIEVALPLEAINKESAREKSIRHGHPSTLHLWWARRPLAAARAVIWSSLVDDPSSHPEQFPTEEAQTAERERLFRILEKLVVWENSNNPEVLDEAKAEIMKSTGGNPPALLDPFAGGGAIPLEAQRLGLEAHAHDLNPVAVMINKAMIEIPPKFAGQPPVHPGATPLEGGWRGAAGLAEDVCYYGEWMKQEAFKRIGHLYPKVKDEQGKERTVIAWIWARTVKCPNPACGCEMPLASSFVLSKKRGNETWVEPIVENSKVCFTVHKGRCPKEKESIKQGKGASFCCVCCGSITEKSYIHDEFIEKRNSIQLMAIVAESDRGRIYLPPTEEQQRIAKAAIPEWEPEEAMNTKTPNLVSGRGYGITHWKELFTSRQLTALTTFTDLVSAVQKKVIEDGGSEEYGQAVRVYLALAISKMTNIDNAFVPWSVTRDQAVQLFSRQAIPMVWDFAENNVFSNSAGDFMVSVSGICKVIESFESKNIGIAEQHAAQTGSTQQGVMVSTDPPYYDMIGYADLSDFFYVWQRASLKQIYPELFKTMLVPKNEELVAIAYRFDGDRDAACGFFENGMLETFKQINIYACDEIPVTVYYAYKQNETESESAASTGWETMLSAIIRAGFAITGTWPVRSERPTGLKVAVNALASSIVLVCRKRPTDAPMCTRRDFINALKRELKPALQKLQASNIAPVDLQQSAIGPGMGVYSRYSKVLEADGTPMSVRAALQIINQELDLFFNEQDGELDKESRFCVELYTQCSFNDIKFGEADVLARAKNTSVDKLRADGVLYSEKGVVHLLTREEIPMEVSKDKGIWLLTQQLTRAMETDGVMGAAKIVKEFFTSEPERAKALAYRLFTLAERRGWAAEAYAYNSLIVAWPDVQSKAAELSAAWSNAEQQSLFTSGEISSGEV